MAKEIYPQKWLNIKCRVSEKYLMQWNFFSHFCTDNLIKTIDHNRFLHKYFKSKMHLLFTLHIYAWHKLYKRCKDKTLFLQGNTSIRILTTAKAIIVQHRHSESRKGQAIPILLYPKSGSVLEGCHGSFMSA